MAIVTDPDLLAQLNSGSVVTDPALLSQLNADEPGFASGLKSGFLGQPGKGVGHAIGEAAIPVAMTALGSLGGPGGAIAGAAAGSSIKEAIKAGADEALDVPESQKQSTVSKIATPAVDAGLQAVGEKYVAPAVKAVAEPAWDAVKSLGKGISTLLAETSGAGRAAVDVLVSYPERVLAATKTVSQASVDRAESNLPSISLTQKDPLIEKALNYRDPVQYLSDALGDADTRNLFLKRLQAEEEKGLTIGEAAPKTARQAISDLENYLIQKSALQLKPWINENIGGKEAAELGGYALAAHALGGVPTLAAVPATIAVSPKTSAIVIGRTTQLANAAENAAKLLANNDKTVSTVVQALAQAGVPVSADRIKNGIMQEAHDHPALDPRSYVQIVHDNLLANPSEYKEPKLASAEEVGE